MFMGISNSKIYRYYLIKKYGSKVNVGIKENELIVKLLVKEYDLEKIEIKNLDNIFLKHAILDNVDASNCDICVYRIINNSKSRSIYNYAYNNSELNNEDIIIAFENISDFIVSNLNIVQTYLILIKGISEFDYKHKTGAFFSYINILDYFYKYKLNKLFKLI